MKKYAKIMMVKCKKKKTWMIKYIKIKKLSSKIYKNNRRKICEIIIIK